MSGQATKTGKPVAEIWFSVEACGNDILRLRESHVDSYAVGDLWLVRGTERALVIDCGLGIVEPAPLVEAIAKMPVTAIALNSSYDHAGGWFSFADRVCHAAEAPFLNERAGEQDDIGDYLNDETLWALPYTGYRVENYTLTPARATRLVGEGDVFDLGGRRLEVLELPGRSAGGLAIWEPPTGSLFPSDMLYDGSHGLAWPPGDPAAYCDSLRRMRDLPVTCVYAGHYGTFGRARMLEIIDEQLANLGF